MLISWGGFSTAKKKLGRQTPKTLWNDVILHFSDNFKMCFTSHVPRTCVRLNNLNCNKRMAKFGRDHWRSSGPNSLLKQGSLRAHYSALCPDSFQVSPAKETFPWKQEVFWQAHNLFVKLTSSSFTCCIQNQRRFRKIEVLVKARQGRPQLSVHNLH